MGILQRTSDLVAANLNDLVDRFEDPQRMLRHALRQMDVLLETMSLAVARSIAAERLLAKTREEHLERAAEWQRRAALAVGEGDDATARRAIARQLDHQHAARLTEKELVTAQSANERLRGELAALRDKQASGRTKLALLSARQTAATAQRQLATAWGSHEQARTVTRFDYFCQQVELAEAEAMALVELETHDEAQLDAEFERRRTKSAIDTELTRLKADHNASPA
jgi:phage shock protein A